MGDRETDIDIARELEDWIDEEADAVEEFSSRDNRCCCQGTNDRTGTIGRR